MPISRRFAAPDSATSAAKATARLPEWNLADLYAGVDSDKLKADLAGVEKDAGTFEERYKGKLVKARLLKDGRVRHDKKVYSSVSAAASAVRKAPANGWVFWQFQRGPGEWVPIDELRND